MIPPIAKNRNPLTVPPAESPLASISEILEKNPYFNQIVQQRRV
jgi:hypothetical protein